MTEAETIEEARRGNGEAVHVLYDRYASRVLTVVRRLCGEDDMVQDLAQEVWLRAIRALPSFRGAAQFSTWLHRIAVNTALQAQRREKAGGSREVPLPPSLEEARETGPRDILLARRLEAAISRLPEGMRRVLVLHDVEGFTHEEIAELLGIAPGTSKSQLFKARARIRELLAPELLESKPPAPAESPYESARTEGAEA